MAANTGSAATRASLHQSWTASRRQSPSRRRSFTSTRPRIKRLGWRAREQSRSSEKLTRLPASTRTTHILGSTRRTPSLTALRLRSTQYRAAKRCLTVAVPHGQFHLLHQGTHRPLGGVTTARGTLGHSSRLSQSVSRTTADSAPTGGTQSFRLSAIGFVYAVLPSNSCSSNETRCSHDCRENIASLEAFYRARSLAS